MTEGHLERYRDVLAASVVFEGLGLADLTTVMARCELVEVDAGEDLLEEGVVGRGLWIVLAGEVEVFLPQRSMGPVRRDTRVRLNVLGPGRCLGEYGLIDRRPSSASALALTPARLSFLAHEDFRAIADANDRVGKVMYLNLLRFLVTRLRSKDQELDLVLLFDEAARTRR